MEELMNLISYLIFKFIRCFRRRYFRGSSLSNSMRHNNMTGTHNGHLFIADTMVVIKAPKPKSNITVNAIIPSLISNF